MTGRSREHPEAHAELRAAAHWYEDQRAGLGNDLYDAVDAAVAEIIRWPDASPPYFGAIDAPPLRARRVAGYPYRVVYLVEPDGVVVFAYVHDRRRPGYWLRRLND